MNTMDEEQLRAYANLFYYRQAIGPRAEYYLEQFEKFERAGGRWVATWNWPAFFFSSGWFAYRRMGGPFVLNFFLPILFIVMIYALIESELRFLVIAGYLALAFVVAMGDRFKDQRFATHAEEKGGTISWTCRTIDLDPKYLPAACR